MGILDGSGALAGALWSGQALVYSVRAVADHPQVVGTNRHVMCGMVELSDMAWDGESKRLTFSADVIGGEPMCITIANPGTSNYKAVDVTCDVAEVTLKPSDNCIKVIAKSAQNVTCEIAVCFE